MSKLTQGTQVYFYDPATVSDGVYEVQCAVDIDLGGSPADQLDDTCLVDTARSYKPGLRTPAASSLTLRPDPENAVDVLMQEMFNRNPSPDLMWAVGWSDASTAPTIDSVGDWSLPTDRTWCVFVGYIADFSFSFTGNSLVSTAGSIQRSGLVTWVPATT